MDRLFGDITIDEGNVKLALEEVDDMLLSNPNTSIAKAADSFLF